MFRLIINSISIVESRDPENFTKGNSAKCLSLLLFSDSHLQLRLPPIFCRCTSRKQLKLTREIGGAWKSVFKSDLCNGHITVLKDVSTGKDSSAAKIFHRSAVQVALENALTFAWRNRRTGSQVIKCDSRLQVSINPPKNCF